VFKISIKYLYGSCINSLGLFIKMSDKYPVLPGPTIYPAAVSDGLSRYVQAPAKAVSFGGATCTSSCYLYGCRKNSQRIKYKLSQNKSQITEPWHHDYVIVIVMYNKKDFFMLAMTKLMYTVGCFARKQAYISLAKSHSLVSWHSCK